MQEAQKDVCLFRHDDLFRRVLSAASAAASASTTATTASFLATASLVLLCCPGWCTMAPSWLTADLTSLGSSDPASSDSSVAGTTGICHYAQLIFVFFFFFFFGETGFHHVAHAGLKLVDSSNPALTSQNARIIDMSHCAWPEFFKSHFVTQARVQWCDLSSLQPPGLKQSSHWICHCQDATYRG
ncbi:hypothetical protein AAY473_008695 [Plecturocebus cupreus]